MAFARNNNASNNNAADRFGDRKASHYINLYLERENGVRYKVYGVPLLENSEDAQQLAEWLTADEANVEKFRSALVIEVNSTERKAGSRLKLG